MSVRSFAVAATIMAGSYIGLPAHAATTGYTSFWALGDSLTDPGNLYGLSGELVPAPPYAQRLSNGPVWVEYVADDFQDANLPVGNFAYGFARAIPNIDPFPWQVPDLPQQIDLFEAQSDGLLGDRPLAALWFGANDLFASIEEQLLSGAPNPAAVIGTAVNAAIAVGEGIRDIAEAGVRDFLVFNLPPLELTPRFALPSPVGIPAAAPLAGLGADTFNASLKAILDGLDDDLNVSLLDMDSILTQAVANPGLFGLSDATNPCYIPGLPLETACSADEAASKLFFDLVHPTTAAHRKIADIVEDRISIAPVPVPASFGFLIAAMGLLGLGSRRSISRSAASCSPFAAVA